MKIANSRSSCGQAILELVFVLSLGGIFLIALVTFSRYQLIRQRAFSAARLGCQMWSSGRISKTQVEDTISIYMNKLNPIQNLDWRVDVGRFDRTPASRFYRLAMVSIQGQIHLSQSSLVPFSPLTFTEHVVMQEASLE